MILIAGGTGRLGRESVRRLTARGLEVRILTRDPARAEQLRGNLVEIMQGDVRDAAAVQRAAAGVKAVISAIHGFAGTGDEDPRTVDQQGNSNLIAAARENGVDHFILMSIYGSGPDHPMELMRMKHLAEGELKRSGISWTIIRPTAYMETYLQLLGQPLIETGKTRIFGRGKNAINFVSVQDVADVVMEAILDPALRDVDLNIGGPQDLTMEQFVATVQEASGRTGSVSHVPLPMMRLMGTVMRPFNRTIAQQVQAGVVMDTYDMSFDGSGGMPEAAPVPCTSLAEVVRREYSG